MNIRASNGLALKQRHFNVPFSIKASSVKDDGTFEGYGSVFDTVDHYNEVVAKGAFLASLKEHEKAGSMPALLYQHDHREVIGAWLSMHEDENGLACVGKLCLDVQRAKETYALLKMKALNGMSIGFNVRKYEVDEESEDRLITLKEIELWECSIVTFPANPDARIATVRAFREGKVPTKRELERALREDLHMSATQAKALIAKGYDGIARDVIEAEESPEGKKHDLTEHHSVANDILKLLKR